MSTVNAGMRLYGDQGHVVFRFGRRTNRSTRTINTAFRDTRLQGNLKGKPLIPKKVGIGGEPSQNRAGPDRGLGRNVPVDWAWADRPPAVRVLSSANEDPLAAVETDSISKRGPDWDFSDSSSSSPNPFSPVVIPWSVRLFGCKPSDTDQPLRGSIFCLTHVVLKESGLCRSRGADATIWTFCETGTGRDSCDQHHGGHNIGESVPEVPKESSLALISPQRK